MEHEGVDVDECGLQDPQAQHSTRALVDTHLSPRWLVRIATDAAPLAAELRRQPWATGVEVVAGDSVRVDAMSLEAGARGIPAAVVACDGRLVACEPLAADLEAAFLALNSKEPQP